MKPIQQPALKRSSFNTATMTVIAIISILILGIGGVVYAESEKIVSNGEGGEVAFITTATLTPSLTPEGTLTFTPTSTTRPSDTPAATATPAATRTTPPTTAPTETAAVTDEPTNAPTTDATISETATAATQEMIALSPIAAASTTPTGEATQVPTPTSTPVEGATVSDVGSIDNASGTWFILAMVIVVVLAGLYFRANTSGQKE
jgi:hypothetical protein